MSIWIRAVCRISVEFTSDEIAAGIAERLDLLTSLFCPADEEAPSAVLARLRVETLGPEAWAIYYNLSGSFMRVERWRGTAASNEARELRLRLYPAVDGAPTVIALLDSVSEIFGFELKSSDADSMGWPVAVSTSAWLAARGQGLVHAEAEGWLAPTRKEIKPILRDSSTT